MHPGTSSIDSFESPSASSCARHDLAEIDVRPRPAMVIDDVASGHTSSESLRHVVADLEAAGLDMRTDRRHQIAAFSDLGSQRGHAGFDHVRYRALPPAVDSGDRAALAIGDQHRNAVGDFDPARNTGRARKHDVRFALENLFPSFVAAKCDRLSAVNLGDDVQSLGEHTERLCRGLHVGREGLSVVPRRAEVQ